MVSLRDLPSASTIYTAYASLSASTMLLRTTFNQVIPLQLQNLILSTIRHYILKPKNTSTLTLIIDQNNGMAQNEIFNASEIYTSTKINPQTNRLKISKGSQDNHLTLKLADSQTTLVDSFQGVEITWRFICQELKDTSNDHRHHDTYDDFDNFLVKEKRSFELSFDKKHKDLVLNRYVPFVLERAKAIRDEKKVVKLHTLTNPCSARVVWDSVKLDHPSTFDKLAMEPSLKKSLVDDLDRFLDRKEYYKKVGRAWKRGYLLYGPPGTGKSSLIAAMANYLKFDIYDLQLMNVINDSSLRKLLLSTTNKSILVIEDIDCSVELPDRSYNTDQHPKILQFTLAGLLNFIDGLWSSCGDERIIIFTTNNKDRLDPALLRPGRMDVHIHMSYLTIDGFKLLASNYLGIDEHWRYREIEELIKSIQVTPAEIAEELMQSTDADFCLGGLVNFLKRKNMDSTATETNSDDDDDGTRSIQLPKAKRPKALPIYE